MDHQSAYQKAKMLVSQMTLEEKAAQLRYDAPAIDRLGIPSYNWWNEALHGVAFAGTATVFPQAIALAATFDSEAVQRTADAISTEGRAKYNAACAYGDKKIYRGLTFWSPNVNIFRDPRWGRGQETYGEDPYLTARTGLSYVRGLQGDPDAAYMKAAACAKHYAVHSGPESCRHSFDVHCSKKDLRETYTYAFEKLVKVGKVEAVMGAYNCYDGEPCCANKELMRLLRQEWGFQGHFISDCWAIADFHSNHHVTDTAPESAALALKTGCDLNCGDTYLQILAAYKEGLVTEEDITQACERLMATRFRLGMFDEECEYNHITIAENDTDTNNELALEIAQKSMVLLKNDGILPLNPNKIKTIAVIGPNADIIKALEGNYFGTSSRYITFLEGIRRECEKHGIRVLYSLGCHLWDDHYGDLSVPADRYAEAQAMAEAADLVILCLGLDSELEGEEGDQSNPYSSGDKADLQLPKSQRTLIQRIKKTNKPVVTLNASGSAIAIDFGNAILQTWYSGQAGGKAAANILFGHVSPSGKLPVTFYRSIEDLPPFDDYNMSNRTYRYFTKEALYPFGYGLSYSRFVCSEIEYDGKYAYVSVVNAGKMDGENVVQAYLKAEQCSLVPPNPVLCGYERIYLKAGESKRVQIVLNPDAFTAVNNDGQRVTAGKYFTLYIGNGQPDQRTQALTGEKCLSLFITI